MIERDPDLWLVSCGGCATNTIADYLHDVRGICVKTDAWTEWKCHAGRPFPDDGIKCVYVYARDVSIALASQKRRGLHMVNYEKMHRGVADPEPYSDARMLEAMRKQASVWIQESRSNPQRVLAVAYEDLWSEESLLSLERFLGIDGLRLDFPEKRTRLTSAIV